MKNVNFRFVIFICTLALLFILGRFFAIDMAGIDAFLHRIGFVPAALVFIFIYVAGTFIIWYLKDPLKLLGAVFFGAILSTVLIYVAELINAAIFFFISRRLGREWVDRHFPSSLKGYYNSLGKMGLGWIFLLRAAPVIPYRVMDLCFGLSGISFRRYIVPVILASGPRIFWIQFPLAAVKSISLPAISEYFLANPFVLFWYFIYTFFVFIVLILFWRKLRKDKKRASGD